MTVGFVELEIKQKTNCAVTIGDYIVRAKIKSVDKNFEAKRTEIVWPALEKVVKRAAFDPEFSFDESLNCQIEDKNNQLREILLELKFIFVKSLKECRMLRSLLHKNLEVSVELI